MTKTTAKKKGCKETERKGREGGRESGTGLDSAPCILRGGLGKVGHQFPWKLMSSMNNGI